MASPARCMPLAALSSCGFGTILFIHHKYICMCSWGVLFVFIHVHVYSTFQGQAQSAQKSILQSLNAWYVQLSCLCSRACLGRFESCLRHLIFCLKNDCLQCVALCCVALEVSWFEYFVCRDDKGDSDTEVPGESV